MRHRTGTEQQGGGPGPQHRPQDRGTRGCAGDRAVRSSTRDDDHGVGEGGRRAERRGQTPEAARSSPPPKDGGPGPARPHARPRGTVTPEGCSGKARPQSWTWTCLHGTPHRVGAASAFLLCTAQKSRRMTRRNVPYPPYRALPPPSPYRMGRRGMQPLSRGRRLAWEQQMRRWVARGDPAPALRLWLAHVSRALPPRR